MKKWRLIVLLIALLIMGSLWASNPELVKLTSRPFNPVMMSDNLKKEIRDNTTGLSAQEITLYCYEKTKVLLKFTVNNHTFDDSKVTGMNCVGYAQVCATLCNFAFKENGVTANAKPVVGHVRWNGINFNNFAKIMPKPIYNFTKDHDFVEVCICNKRKIYVDPSLSIVNL